MVTKKVREIYFSPTKTTQKTVEAIARSMGIDQIETTDLTKPLAGPVECGADETVVIGVPVYGGRVPATAMERLKGVKGRNTPAILAAVYGNRHYDDALLELSDMLIENGFIPIAGGAFIGEHSLSTPKTPLGAGRPDPEDMAAAREFGRQVRAKQEKTDSAVEPLRMPGNRPYREWTPPKGPAPVTKSAGCTLCGKCAEVCPVGAVRVDGSVETDGELCIICTACVKSCPAGVRIWENEKILGTADRLAKLCREYRKPAFFL